MCVCVCVRVCVCVSESTCVCVQHSPLTLGSMKMVEGVSEIWLQKYGTRFLETVGTFSQSQEVDVPMDVHMSAPSQHTQPTSMTIKVRILYITQHV